MNDSGKAVFLSYASQDADAAKRICETLRATGVEVWFDQSELVGGDAWDQKIRRQIKDCALLIPIISAATQARTEGYFRLEWRLADQRTHLMAKGRPFLLPVVIDSTRDIEAHVPDSFTEVQWTKLPGGETSPAFAQRVKRLLDGGNGSSAGVGASLDDARSEANDGRRQATPRQQKSPRWLRPILASGAIVIAVLAVTLITRRDHETVAPPGASVRPALAAQPAAVAEFPRDPELKRAVKLIYSLNAIEPDFALAEDIVKPVLAARPNEAEVVTVAAMVAQEYLTRGFDTSDARRATVQKLAERAVQLAPDNPDALAALSRYLAYMRTQLPRAEELVRRAIELRPDESRYYRNLLEVIVRTKSGAEVEAFLAQMVARFPADALVRYDLARSYKDRNDVVAMEKALDETLALGPVAFAFVWKSWARLAAHGDVAGMKAALDGVPDRQRTNTRVANALSIYGTISGDTAAAIKLVGDLPDTWLSDFDFNGPKALLLGDLLTAAGRKEPARFQYEAAFAEIQREKARNPTDLRLRIAEMWTLLGLGRAEEAHALLPLALEAYPRPYRATLNSSWWSGPVRASLLLGEREQALTLIKEAVEPQSRLLLRNYFRVDPRMAPFRDDAEIKVLLAEPVPVKTSSFAKASEDKEDRGQKTEVSAPIDQKSVAVLAFANLSDDKNNEYFSDGISEELLNVLAKVPGLKVSARTSAFYFKGKEVPVPEIARQLGVAYVVEGSVRKAGDKVRITAQLIKAADGFHVWSDTFTRDLKDIFAVQDEIAGLIAKNLELKMGLAAARPTVDLEAYQEYLTGRALFAKAGNGDLQEAVGHFEKAVAIEPKFTAAWVQLASAHTQLGRWGGVPTLQAWSAARVAIDRARALEPDSPEVLLALGWILRTSDWDWRGAEQAFRRSLQLRPNHPDTLAALAVLLFNIGKTEEAFRLGRQAAQIDPLNPATQVDLSLMFFFNNNGVEAEHAARRALQLAPGGAGYHSNLAWAFLVQRRLAEAEAEAILDTDESQQAAVLGVLAVARGQGGAARAQVARLEAIARNAGDRADLQQTIAWICVGLGEKDRAFAALVRAGASRDPSMSWLRNVGFLAPLYSDPRWEPLLHQVGLADDQLK